MERKKASAHASEQERNKEMTRERREKRGSEKVRRRERARESAREKERERDGAVERLDEHACSDHPRGQVMSHMQYTYEQALSRI